LGQMKVKQPQTAYEMVAIDSIFSIFSRRSFVSLL
jgi:hypothetical protein